MKTIYIARSANDNTDSIRVTFRRDEARREARCLYDHLTDRERRVNTVSVEAYRVDVSEDDPRSAEQLYNDLMADGDDALFGDPAEWEEIRDEN